SHPREVEEQVHRALASSRVNVDREFFRVSVEDAIDAVRSAMLNAAGVRAWTGSPIHRLRGKDRVALSLRTADVFVLLAYPDLTSPASEILDIWEAHSDGDTLE